jgi:hypothetical protein
VVAGEAAVIMRIFTIDGPKYFPVKKQIRGERCTSSSSMHNLFIRTRFYGDANTEAYTQEKKVAMELRRGCEERRRRTQEKPNRELCEE